LIFYGLEEKEKANEYLVVHSNREDGTYWMTTGMYPQEFTLKLQREKPLTKIRIASLNIRHLKVDACFAGQAATQWTQLQAVELEDRHGSVQSEILTVPNAEPIALLRFVIASGWQDFSAVYKINLVANDA